MRSVLSAFCLSASAVFGAGEALAFEAGTLGDAYQDSGYIQGCTDEGELPGCTIVVGGSQFVAPADGQTPPDVMETLKSLPQLTYVDFNLDTLNVYDSYAEVAVSFVAPSQKTDPFADKIKAMQGDWISTDDPKAAVRVDGLIWNDVYDNEPMGQSVMSLDTICAEEETGGADILQLYQLGSADMMLMCYALVSVDAENLELSYIGRGNTLAFTRP